MTPANANPAAGDRGARKATFSGENKSSENSQHELNTQAAARGWRDVLRIHPADLFPLMSETDPQGLKKLSEDIKKHGLQSPIVVMAERNGKEWVYHLLDGRNRLDAIELAGFNLISPARSKSRAHRRRQGWDCGLDPLLGLPCGGVGLIRFEMGVDDPFAYIISANIDRRHLTAGQTRPDHQGAQGTPKKSNNAIAKPARCTTRPWPRSGASWKDVRKFRTSKPGPTPMAESSRPRSGSRSSSRSRPSFPAQDGEQNCRRRNRPANRLQQRLHLLRHLAQKAKEGEDRRTMVYGVREALDHLAGIALTGDEFLNYARPHQLWDQEEGKVIEDALRWLTSLAEAWKRPRKAVADECRTRRPAQAAARHRRERAPLGSSTTSAGCAATETGRSSSSPWPTCDALVHLTRSVPIRCGGPWGQLTQLGQRLFDAVGSTAAMLEIAINSLISIQRGAGTAWMSSQKIGTASATMTIGGTRDAAAFVRRFIRTEGLAWLAAHPRVGQFIVRNSAGNHLATFQCRAEVEAWFGQQIDLVPTNEHETPQSEARDDRNAAPPRLVPIHWGQLNSLPKREPLIDGLLDVGAMSAIVGPTSAYKTGTAIDLGGHIAVCIAWRGLPVRQGGVVYVAVEGGLGIAERLDAWRQHHGVSADEGRFYLIPEPIDLAHGEADARLLIQRIAELGSIDFVVIDTTSRALAGGDENSPKDMGAFVRNSDLVREATGAHLCGVHHFGKDEVTRRQRAFAAEGRT